jgi:hypothetical protein
MSDAYPKFDMVWQYRSPNYPCGEEGGNFFVPMIFTCRHRYMYRKGGGGRHPVVVPATECLFRW